MKECVIFCAAGFDGLAIPLTEEDYLIAADGGLKHMESLGVTGMPGASSSGGIFVPR